MIIIAGCRSNRIRHANSRTPDGTISFYSVKGSSNSSSSGFYAEVDSNGTRIFYSFYPVEILKTKENQKVVKYSLYCGTHPQSADPNIFQSFTALDWRVLRMGDSIARLKGLTIKGISDCNGFELEIYQLHGWPEGKKFKPL